MRYFLLIFLFGSLGFSCIKKAPSNPIPEIEFKDFKLTGTGVIGDDDALFTIGYKDYDGDLFGSTNDDQNLFIRTYAFDKAANKFIVDGKYPYSYAVIEPAEGYYKGKSIQGDILIPTTEFRSDSSIKIIKFEVWMLDMKDNKSNVVTSPTYTIK